MGDAANGWPSIGKTDPNIEVHAHILKTELKELQKQTTNDGKSFRKMPQTIQNALFKSMEAFIDAAVAAKKKETRLANAIQEIKTNTAKTSMMMDSMLQQQGQQPHSAKQSTVRSWAAVAAGYPSPPATIPASITSRNSSAAARIDEPEHREITIHFESAEDARNLRQLGEQWIVNKINEAIHQSQTMVNNAQATATQPKQKHTAWVNGARILRSGDVVALAINAATAERLTHHADEWQKLVAKSAKIQKPSFGVVLQNIGVGEWKVDAGVRGVMQTSRHCHDFIQENLYFLKDSEITWMGWLAAPQGNRKTASLVVKFATAVQANAAIKAGKLSWKGRPREVFRYDHECRVCQCQVCKQYGHVARHCTKPFTCGWCGKAGLDRDTPPHPERECPEKGEHGRKKCTLCGKEHSAWSPTCTHRKEELKRIQRAKEKTKTRPYFHEPTLCSPGPSEIGQADHSSQTHQEPAQRGREESPRKRKAQGSAGSPAERKSTTSPSKNARLHRRRPTVVESDSSDLGIQAPKPPSWNGNHPTVEIEIDDGDADGSQLSQTTTATDGSRSSQRTSRKDYAALSRGQPPRRLPGAFDTDPATALE